jgi:dihydroorotate dehydrogenase
MLLRVLHRLPPEAAHRVGIQGLRWGVAPRVGADRWPVLRTALLGLDLPNPLGLAAGFDKDAEAAAGLAGLGFGFVEVGTITPRPQAGNPRPRLFRLPAEQALINRMGFNGAGLEAARRRLARLGGRRFVLGANIGANRDSVDPAADYVRGLEALHGLVDYLVVNVSSPNTPGLRDLQARDRLDRLLAALLARRAGLAGGGRPTPLLVKLAPDLAAEDEAAIAEVALGRGIDGLIIGNTTIERPAGLQGRAAAERGGLSGPPLLRRSTAQLARFHHLTAGRLPLIGVGGISSGRDAYAKIRAGAGAVQLYTALIYQGPAVVGRVLDELAALLAADGYKRLADAVGADAGGTGGARSVGDRR